mmetsp:Transcript_14401/g.46078  ORF Transcript_14401/g.46078 Transcript_14401/m.46078 type:complete len:202 (-) Transcript_14401:344-949(-)
MAKREITCSPRIEIQTRLPGVRQTKLHCPALGLLRLILRNKRLRHRANHQIAAKGARRSCELVKFDDRLALGVREPALASHAGRKGLVFFAVLAPFVVHEFLLCGLDRVDGQVRTEVRRVASAELGAQGLDLLPLRFAQVLGQVVEQAVRVKGVSTREHVKGPREHRNPAEIALVALANNHVVVVLLRDLLANPVGGGREH